MDDLFMSAFDRATTDAISQPQVWSGQLICLVGARIASTWEYSAHLRKTAIHHTKEIIGLSRPRFRLENDKDTSANRHLATFVSIVPAAVSITEWSTAEML